MNIRRATRADAAAVAAIMLPVIRDTAITFTTTEKTEEGVRADIVARGDSFQVAELDGEVVGFATLFPFRAGPGYAHTKEHSIVLAPKAHGQGLGRALMIRLEEVAHESGIHSLFAGVSGENQDGVAFHRAIGFRIVATLPEVGFKFGRWMDLVLMQKIL
ncbi:MAG: GNAT family N-acetyltransferase [Paracoccaceae bacterium]|nr:GNAT family N-acetyltransferase [Paracoccaceae bacterium]